MSNSLVDEMKKYDDVDEQTWWWINQALLYSSYPSKEERNALLDLKKIKEEK